MNARNPRLGEGCGQHRALMDFEREGME